MVGTRSRGRRDDVPSDYTPLTYHKLHAMVSEPIVGPSGGLLIVETSMFTRRVSALFDDESYRLLQVELVRRPGTGAVIPGSGGLRKIRWPGRGSGKRGGLRVIYFWHRSSSVLLLLIAYEKSERDDLSREQLRTLHALVKEEFR